jgi:NADH-quinone oxidoreductase subunit E
MIPEHLSRELQKKISASDHPKELAVEVMYALQSHYGYLSDEALIEGANLLGLAPLELEELATFYDFIYRDPVGKYVIHVCDSVICWMHGHQTIMDYLCEKLGISPGATTEDGMFTLLPVCCIGFCDEAPVVLINGKPYGRLTPEKIDAILEQLKEEQPPLVEAK